MITEIYLWLFSISLTMRYAFSWISVISVESLKTRKCSLISWAKYPIFSAVYNLSPVIIITLIPAFWSREIVYGTPSWSLSSIPVAPIIVRWLSIYSMSSDYLLKNSSFVIIFCLYSFFTAIFFSCQRSNTCLEIILLEKTRVLKPSLAKELRFSLNLAA